MNIIAKTFLRLIPRSVSSWVRRKVAEIATTVVPVPFPGFLPFRSGSREYLIPNQVAGPLRSDEWGVPIPPTELWCGYAQGEVEEYLNGGQRDTLAMIQALDDSGFDLKSRRRVLDFGCASGRMIRHLRDYSSDSEIWGVDISSDHIAWCKANLSPTFHFATSTTSPHLPFPDHHFDLIYAGSVFTHIEDLVDSWLLEIKRILAPSGRFYCTIHDNHTIEVLEKSEPDHWLTQMLHRSSEFQEHREQMGMLVVGRGIESQVFYDRDYFRNVLRDTFEPLVVIEEAYRFQTAIIAKPREQAL